MNKSKEVVRMKFGDMPQGTHFSDGRGRKFIKMMTHYASGWKVKTCQTVNMEDKCNPFNSVDYDGIPANCPDRVEFDIIEPK